MDNNFHRHSTDDSTTLLQLIISQYGDSIIQDPKRFQSLFNDHSGGRYKRELNILLQSFSVDIPSDLNKKKDQVPFDIIRPHLIKRLEENCGIDNRWAEWAVDSWAFALGIISELPPVNNDNQRKSAYPDRNEIPSSNNPLSPNESQNTPLINLKKKTPPNKNISKMTAVSLGLALLLIVLISVFYVSFISNGNHVSSSSGSQDLTSTPTYSVISKPDTTQKVTPTPTLSKLFISVSPMSATTTVDNPFVGKVDFEIAVTDQNGNRVPRARIDVYDTSENVDGRGSRHELYDFEGSGIIPHFTLSKRSGNISFTARKDGYLDSSTVTAQINAIIKDPF